MPATYDYNYIKISDSGNTVLHGTGELNSEANSLFLHIVTSDPNLTYSTMLATFADSTNTSTIEIGWRVLTEQDGGNSGIVENEKIVCRGYTTLETFCQEEDGYSIELGKSVEYSEVKAPRAQGYWDTAPVPFQPTVTINGQVYYGSGMVTSDKKELWIWMDIAQPNNVILNLTAVNNIFSNTSIIGTIVVTLSSEDQYTFTGYTRLVSVTLEKGQFVIGLKKQRANNS